MLSWWQWAVLAAVPPAIVALYFLKLRRRPVEVPSTFLWQKSIEDLHVNSLWQRLRQNLLMHLQLLLLALLILALLGPGWRGEALIGDRFIFLVDNSASMQASDVAPSRLEEARRRTLALIDRMESGDVAMVVSFADSARVEQPFTSDRRALRRAVEGIEPTQRGTSLIEALRVVSGLAGPAWTPADLPESPRSDAPPATLFILSDGNFEDVSGLTLGSLEPVYLPIGTAAAENVGIVAFSVARHQRRLDRLQAFARLENFAPEEAAVGLDLYHDDQLIDASQATVAAGAEHAVLFDLGEIAQGVLRLQIRTGDHLAVDNTAYAVIRPPQRARVLLVTPGNEVLERALGTRAASAMAEIAVVGPSYLDAPQYIRQAASAAWDLVVYDRCRPQEMPEANTFFIAALPPHEPWTAEPMVEAPQVIDTDRSHPLMQWIDVGDLLLTEATPLAVPPGGGSLLDSTSGPLLVVAPRERYEDAVLGFAILDADAGADDGSQMVTNWPLRPSFPVFTHNLLDYLGGRAAAGPAEFVRVGQPVVLPGPPGAEELVVRAPGGQETRLRPSGPARFSFLGTNELGVYEVAAGGRIVDRFAVNLFDPRESDIATEPEEAIRIGFVEVAATGGAEPVRRELWKWLVAVGLVVLLGEWYVYNRRVSA